MAKVQWLGQGVSNVCVVLGRETEGLGWLYIAKEQGGGECVREMEVNLPWIEFSPLSLFLSAKAWPSWVE